MDKYTKSKKSTYATIELFTLKQKANITNDVLDLPNKNDKARARLRAAWQPLCLPLAAPPGTSDPLPGS